MTDQDIENSRVEVRSYFVRHRNALVARAQFSSIYVDYYLHLMQHSLASPAADDAMLKDGLAALTLHLASRPRHQTTAWTLHFEDPLLNLFVTGDSLGERVVGRIFSDNVREKGRALFCSQMRGPGEPMRESTVDIAGRDVFSAVEQFYSQSEQMRARLFRHSVEDIVMVSAQPDCDHEWLESLDEDAIRRLDAEEELSLLETRPFRFDCGCSVERIFPAILPMIHRDGVEALFDGEPHLRVECPRCGAVFQITLDDIEELLETVITSS